MLQIIHHTNQEIRRNFDFVQSTVKHPGDASQSADLSAWSFLRGIWIQVKCSKFIDVAFWRCLESIKKIGSCKKTMSRSIGAASAAPGRRKSRFAGKSVHNLEQLARAIRKVWRGRPTSYAKNLVESMPRRCQAFLNASGDYGVY